MKLFEIPICLVAVTLLLAAIPVPARADLAYTFTHIVEPGDGPDELASGEIGEAQLFVDVAPYDSNRALFTFRNMGPEACSITDVYFDDGVLLQIAEIIDADGGGDSGVDFSQFASPSDLPGGELLSPPFVTTDGFSADSDTPVRPNGVDPNESLGIVFSLDDNGGYQDVINELATGYLRIGIKVQAFAAGGSQSFVNNGPVTPDVLVPDVIGMPLADANSDITAVGLLVGTITYQCSSAPAGQVIAQDPIGGTLVPVASAVDLVVSTGPPVVPYVVGMTQANAELAINTVAYLSVGNVTTECSDTVPAGDVISQDPPAGPTACNNAVNLVVSAGQPTVPNVVGMSLADAEAAIEAVEYLSVGATNIVCSDTVAAGLVINQDPPAGATTCNDTVDLVVSAGQPVVPYVVGMTQAEAELAIEGVAYLSVGNVTTECSDTIPAGDVISQDPPAGATTCNDTVDLVVSRGQPTVPAFTDLPIIIVEEMIGDLEDLILCDITTQCSDTVPAGKVIAQEPSPGPASCGSCINLVVSVGQPNVPDLVCKTDLPAAVSAIEAIDYLCVGTIVSECNETWPPGHVIGQHPSPGPAPCGTCIDLVVSAGRPTVPDVVGMSLPDAEAAIEAVQYLSVGDTNTACSDTVPAGEVIGQDPPPGPTTCNNVVNLVVSTGPPTVPNVIGMPLADAESAIGAVEYLSVGDTNTACSDTVPAGDVIGQDPPPGPTTCNNTVNLVVSAGQPTVPNFVCMMSLAEAQATINAIEYLSLGDVTSECNDTWPEGHVIGQAPPAGPTTCNNTVNLVVSAGQPTVPDFVCMMGLAEAQATINAIEYLSLGDVTYECNDTWPEGHVIGQDPPAGPTTCNNAVNLVVSAGQPTVPNVVGMALADAEAAINAVEYLSVGDTNTACSDTVPAGHVISQDPPAGPTTCYDTVSLVISSGKCSCAVPDVVGLPLPDANSAITAAGLILGSKSYICSSAPADEVIEQNPTAGESVPCGSAVDLVVSAGPPTVPDVVGMSQSDAEAAINAVEYLSVGDINTVYSATEPPGHVIGQDPPPGPTTCNDEVDLVISTDRCEGQTYVWTNAYPWSMLWISPWNWEPEPPYGGPGPSDTALISTPPEGPAILDTDITVCRILGPAHGVDSNQIMHVWGGSLLVESARDECWDAHPEPGGVGTIYIYGNPDITMNGRHRVADHGTIVHDISGDPTIHIGDYFKGGDSSDGRLEFTMSGGSLYVDGIMMIGDDGTGFFDLSGDATVTCQNFKLQVRPEAATAELNISENAVLEAFDADEYGIRICDGDGTAAMNMSGGIVTSASELTLANSEGTGVLNMTDGLIQVAGAFEVPGDGDGTAIVEHLGGVIECAQFTHAGGAPYSYHICGGTLVIDGDVVDDIQADVAAGYIYACGEASCINPERFCSRGDVLIEYDTPEYPGRTKVTASYQPERAWCPTPEDFATDVPSHGTELCWCPGDNAKVHHLWLSTDYELVASRSMTVYIDAIHDTTCYDPGPLCLGTTYYWVVDEQDGVTITPGKVWRFTVEDCRAVEDMEAYTYDPGLIYETWIDGCGHWVGDELISNGTGSCVDLSMAVVHDGAKSMWYAYETVLYCGWERDANYSEARREFDPPLDLTSSCEAALVLWFHGNRDNASTQMWLLLNDNTAEMATYGDYGDDPDDIKTEEWIDWNINLADLETVDLSAVASTSIGFGDKLTGQEQPGVRGVVHFDDISVCPVRCVPKYTPNIYDLNGDCIVDWKDIAIVSEGWLADLR